MNLIKRTLYKNRLLKLPYKFSIVTVVENSLQLHRFVETIAKQSIGSNNLELLLVDKASNAESSESIQRITRKYNRFCRYIVAPEDSNTSSARNFALKHITGDWVNFVSDTDHLHHNFFRHFADAIAAHSDCPIFSGESVSVFKETNEQSHNNPLRKFYNSGVLPTDVLKKPQSHMVSAGNSIFETSLIRRHKIEFETGISDDFADTMFIATYAMETQNHQRCYVQKARHFRNFKYKASLFNQPEWNRPNRYYERLSNGVLPLFRMAEEKYGYIPRFIQNLAIYEMSWIIKKIAKTPMTELPLSEMERTFTQNLLVNICEQIPPQNIHRYNVSGLSQVARLMMLNFAESSWPSTRIVNVHDVDVDNQRLRISFATNSDDNSVLSFNGQDCTVHSTKDVTMKALDYMAATRYQWVSLPSVDENELLITLGKNPALLKYGNIVINNRSENTSQVFAHICAGGISKPIPQSIAYEIQHYQRNGNSKYRDCWLLQDRVDAADDNAEHLYRYICQNHPETNIYFCLSKSSADWPRLEADGFKLVDSESHDHRMCYLHAKHIISSHANPIVTNFLSRQEYGELLRGKFHFIQHGVIAADFSNWLNKKTLHTFVTSSPREYQSIAKSERYAFTDKETILSGLPRHDRLVELSKVHSAKQVLIMPTWRSWLVDKPEGNSPWRKKSGFNETEYFKHWNGVLNSDAIREMYNQGYEIVFNPHPNLRFYIDEFDLPEYVSTPLNSKESMQYLFARAEFMITDYSSVQFEMGLLRKPVFYYQFDKEKVFGGQHTLSKGYFDYDEDGFGPVTYSQYDLELKLYDYLINKDDLVNNTVLPRALKQMPLNDGKCSERVFNHIKRTEGGL